MLSFQSVQLTSEWVGGDTSAYPKDPDSIPWGYGLVNLVLYAGGVGLVVLAGHLADRRRQRRSNNAVELAA